MTGTSILEIRGLSKRLGGKPVIRDVSLAVEPGTVYGFLGRNGAGKTTTLRLVLGLLRPDAGSVHLFGEPLKPGRSGGLERVGALIESPGFYPNLDAKNNLALFARPRSGGFSGGLAGVLEAVGLGDVGPKPFGQYSLGMKQRLGIARTLVNDPELIILDEPTNGLDPAGIREIRTLIRDLAQNRGKTVLVSSHLLSEVEQMADVIGVLHGGTLVDQFSLAELASRHRSSVTLEVDDLERALRTLGSLLPAQDVQGLPPRRLKLVGPADRWAEWNRELVMAGVAVSSMVPSTNNLEEAFLALTDREASHA